MNLRFLKRVFSFTTVMAVMSQPLVAEDIWDIYQLAEKNDPQYRAAQAALSASQELKTQSQAALHPTVTLSAHLTSIDEETTTNTTTSASYDNSGYSLSLSQPLYRHQNFVGLDQANAQVAKAAADFTYNKQNLIIRVASQYFAVLSATDDLAFAEAEKKAISEQLVQTQQRFNVGLTAITDVHEAQARFDQAVASEIVARNALAISKETLHELTAQESSSLASLKTDHPLLNPDPSDINEWVNTALTQNALLNAARHSVEVAQEETYKQRAGHYPTLDLVASHSYNDFGGGITGVAEKEDTSIALKLNVPLYQGGIVNSRTRAANYQFIQAKEKLEQQKRATERQTRNAYLSVFANISQVKALKQALASSSVALEATQAGFEVGTRTAVDVLNSQRELFRANRDYSRARYNYVIETLQLKLAAGTLNENDLQQLKPWMK